ncbi:phage holin family protein [soil metagenome]
MVHLILSFAIGALGLWVAAQVVPGFKIRDIPSLLLATLLLGIANAVIRPVLGFLTFPITILTLGLWLLVLNGLMVALVAVLLKGVKSDGILASILAALVVSIISWLGQGVLHL